MIRRPSAMSARRAEEADPERVRSSVCLRRGIAAKSSSKPPQIPLLPGPFSGQSTASQNQQVRASQGLTTTSSSVAHPSGSLPALPSSLGTRDNEFGAHLETQFVAHHLPGSLALIRRDPRSLRSPPRRAPSARRSDGGSRFCTRSGRPVSERQPGPSSWNGSSSELCPPP